MPAQPQTSTFLGWRVVAATFMLALFGWGFGFYGPPIYLHAVREAHGWSLGLVSIAVTSHYLFGAVVVANLRRLHRHFGIASVTKAGAVSLALGVVGWATAAEPWQLFAATPFTGAGWAAMGAATVNAIIAPWFIRDRPAALATAYNGASIGGVVFSPLWVAAINRLGFPTAAMTLGLVMIVSVWILADAYFARSPQQTGTAADGDTADHPDITVTPASPPAPPRLRLWRDAGFLTLAAGMSLGLFAQVGLLAHLFSLLVPALGTEAAGLATGAATAAAIAGRTLVGWLMPINADRRLVISASLALQGLGLAAFLAANSTEIPLLVLGVILFGAGIGNITSLPPLIAQVEFDRDDAARIVPFIVAISQATYAFAPAAFGLLVDFAPTHAVSASGIPLAGDPATSAAPLMFLATGMIQLLAIAAFLIGRRSRHV